MTPPSYPMPRTEPLNVPPGLAEVAARGPVSRVQLWDGGEAWLVTGWQEARAVLADNRFSAALRHPGYPHVRPGFRGTRVASAAAPGAGGPTLLRMDPPEHDVLRRMLTGFFTVRRTAAMRPAIEAWTDECLDAMQAKGPPADIIETLATPLPSLVLCELLGIPVAERAYFEQLAAGYMAYGATQRQVIGVLRRMTDYLDDLVTRKESDPGDDIIGSLIRDYASAGLLSRTDLLGMVRLLLVAGHETTANMLGLSLAALLADRDAWDGLCADPGAIAAAVEELLRFHTIAQTGLCRVAVEDIEVGGELIHAGEGVIVSVEAANRDPGAFADPDVMSLHRGARHHLSFSFGIHQCLGQALARLELEVALARTMRRYPSLRVADGAGQVAFGHDRMIYGVHRLEVAW